MGSNNWNQAFVYYTIAKVLAFILMIAEPKEYITSWADTRP